MARGGFGLPRTPRRIPGSIRCRRGPENRDQSDRPGRISKSQRARDDRHQRSSEPSIRRAPPALVPASAL